MKIDNKNDYYKSIHYVLVILKLSSEGITDFMSIIVYSSLIIEEALKSDLLKLRKNSDLVVTLSNSKFLKSVALQTIINYYIPYLLKSINIGKKNELLVYTNKHIEITDKGRALINKTKDKHIVNITENIQVHYRICEKISAQNKSNDVLDFLERLGVSQLWTNELN